MQSSRPFVVLVTGAPGSGKTTLGRRLADDLGCAFLSKDAIKERLADTHGLPHTVADSNRLGARAYAALFEEARVAASDEAVVVESNFRRGMAEPELAEMASAVETRVVHCTTTRQLIEARYRARWADRHPAHLDGLRVDDVLRDLDAGTYEPLQLAVPTLLVQTDHGYQPSYDAVLAFAADGVGG